jgi:hypothetical protein
VDESDDADGHRIYFNPWATAEDDHEDDHEDEAGWSAQDPPASPDDW